MSTSQGRPNPSLGLETILAPPRYISMEIMTALAFLASLWASISLVASALLAAVYVAERAGRRSEPIAPSERTALTSLAA